MRNRTAPFQTTQVKRQGQRIFIINKYKEVFFPVIFPGQVKVQLFLCTHKSSQQSATTLKQERVESRLYNFFKYPAWKQRCMAFMQMLLWFGSTKQCRRASIPSFVEMVLPQKAITPNHTITLLRVDPRTTAKSQRWWLLSAHHNFGFDSVESRSFSLRAIKHLVTHIVITGS